MKKSSQATQVEIWHNYYSFDNCEITIFNL